MYSRRRPRRVKKYTRKFKRRGISSLVNRKVYRALKKNIETKFADVTSTTSVQLTQFIAPMTNSISQGTTDNTRVGDKILLKSIQSRFVIGAADPTNQLRLTLIRWNQNDATVVPTAAAIYADPTNIQTLFNYHELRQGNFSIIHDKIYSLTLNSDSSQKILMIYRKINKPIKYNHSVNTAKGNLYWIWFSDSGAIPHCPLTHYTRIKYTDA